MAYAQAPDLELLATEGAQTVGGVLGWQHDIVYETIGI